MSFESLDSAPPNLEDQLAECRVKSVFPEGSWFFPDGSVEDLINRNSIIHEFYPSGNECPEGSGDDEVIDFILESAKKLFAICVYSRFKSKDLKTVMANFKQHHVSDYSLPFDNSIDKYPWFSTKLWRPARIADVEQRQWMFLAPVFPSSYVRLVLKEGHILPFTFMDSEKKEGTFGDVSQVTIHESHQEKIMRKVDGSPANAALKELKASASVKKQSGNQRSQQILAKWEAEAKALEETSGLGHPHIVSVKAIITKGTRRYFLFQWADGGSLRDLYQDEERPSLSSNLIKEVVHQLSGLADALHKLHNYQKTESYRHGDLKPENILMFKDNTHVGVWKIADMGLAKRHISATAQRGPTSTRDATPSYEPPEVKTRPNAAWSRLYDIWSMGCVTLEIIVWLLYGHGKLEELNKGIVSSDGHPGPYWLYDQPTKTARVHPTVIAYMEHIKTDPEGRASTAIRDLLRIVEDKLLVVPLSPRSETFRLAPESTTDIDDPQYTGAQHPHIVVTDDSQSRNPVQPPPPEPIFGPSKFRATAEDFCNALRAIEEEGEKDDAYWFTGTKRDGLSSPSLTQHGPQQLLSAPAIEQKKMTYSHEPLDSVWNFPIDNAFAQSVLKNRVWYDTVPRHGEVAKLCSKCRTLDLWAGTLGFQDNLEELERRSMTCDFCRMRWEVCKNIDRSYGSTVYFDKDQSNLRLNEGHPPVLTVHISPEHDEMSQSKTWWQIGLPQLPQVASSSYFEIMRQWLIDCDHNHPKCRRSSARDLPTRLIYVGTLVNPSLSLYETQPRDNMRYSALSHPWGKPPHFCTFPSTIDNHKKGIDFYDLPLTFRNAITVTRELNLQYLWIDSICIIQGPDGDFENEATRMEAVFSNAYCVLAACSVLGQGDSFLNERKKRKNISLKYEGKPAIFVCEFMDNFNQDVLESNLSQRGWVLQERALARRTIYFTDKQTYWECGGGVRCETMARMDNTLASFLGDPNFPKVAIESSRGGKILFHQSLCKQYSRLAFTRQTDRPVAISGLEKRLVQSFGVSGGYGVLNDTKNPGMLRRSMLWHRASDCTTLRRISFARSAPPTWSCMSYEGPIDYPDLPFAQVEWEQCDIQSQFLESGTEYWYSSDNKSSSMGMAVVVRNVDVTAAATGKTGKVILDVTEGAETEIPSKCVVLGKLKSSILQGEHGRTYAVLLVKAGALRPASAKSVYVRIGIAFVSSTWIPARDKGVKGMLV